MKLLYKPVSMLTGLAGGAAAGAVFHRLWRATTDEETSPNARQPNERLSKVLAAGMLQGAVFGLVKTAFDRAGAKAYASATGTWPEKARVEA